MLAACLQSILPTDVTPPTTAGVLVPRYTMAAPPGIVQAAPRARAKFSTESGFMSNVGRQASNYHQSVYTHSLQQRCVTPVDRHFYIQLSVFCLLIW